MLFARTRKMIRDILVYVSSISEQVFMIRSLVVQLRDAVITRNASAEPTVELRQVPESERVSDRLNALTEQVNLVLNAVQSNVLKAEYLPFSVVQQHANNLIRADESLYIAFKSNLAMLMYDRYNVNIDQANAMAVSIIELIWPKDEAKPLEREPLPMPARKLLHVTVGNADYSPTQEELDSIVEAFSKAELSPSVGVVATSRMVTSVLADTAQVTPVAAAEQ